MLWTDLCWDVFPGYVQGLCELCFPLVNLSCCEGPSCKPKTGKGWYPPQRPILRRQNVTQGQVSVKFCFRDNKEIHNYKNPTETGLYQLILNLICPLSKRLPSSYHVPGPAQNWSLSFTCAWMLSHFSCVWLSATPWYVPHQAPLSIGFSRQEYWSGLPQPLPGDLPDQGSNLYFLHWQVESSLLGHWENPV